MHLTTAAANALPCCTRNLLQCSCIFTAHLLPLTDLWVACRHDPSGPLNLCVCHLQNFGRVLTLAFTAMTVLYGLVSAAGYLYWGRGAQTLVTTDLTLHSPFSGRAKGLSVDTLVDLCILVNVFTTYPSLVLVMQVGNRPNAACAGYQFICLRQCRHAGA